MRNGLQKIVLALFLFCFVTGLSLHAVDADYSDRMLFADGLFARQMYDLAKGEYESILQVFPDGEENDAATFRLAESLRFLGDLTAAGRMYARVVVDYRDSPYRLRAAYRRARLYAEAGDLDSAQAHLEVILATRPEPELAAATQYHLGDVLFRKGNLDDADRAMVSLLTIYPDSDFTVFAYVKRAEIRRSRLAALQAEGKELDNALFEEALSFYQLALDVADTDRLIAEVLFQQADIYFRQGSFAEAASLYRRLLQDYPSDARSREALMQAAWAALRAALYAEALAVAQRALDDPDASSQTDEWLYILANSQRQLLQNEAAGATYADLLLRFPASRFAAAARYETAVAYYQAGNYAAAAREAEKIRLDSDLRVDVSWLLAESYAALNRPGEAVQNYRIVVREGGGSERVRDALYRLAHHLQQQGALREASRYYLQLVESFPESELAPQALFASGYALSAAESHEEAVRDWRQLVQRYPNDPLAEEALYQKAMGEIRLQRHADAASSLSEFQRLYQDSRYLADVLYWQGMLRLQKKEYAEAEPLFRQVQELGTRETLQRDAQYQLGLVLQQLGRLAESAKILDALVATPMRAQLSPTLLEWLATHHGDSASYAPMQEAAHLLTEQSDPAWKQAGYTLLGRSLLAQEQHENAASAWRTALAIDVQTAYAGEAALQLGQMEMAQQNWVEAEKLLRRVSALASGAESDGLRARALVGLGKVALGQDRIEEAVRLFLSVGILYDDPTLVPESFYLAAQSFQMQGRQADVEKVLAELTERYPDSEWTEKARSAWGS